MKKILLLPFAFMLTTPVLFSQQVQMFIEPEKDNTIYSEGELSNGKGNYIFAGVTKEGALRRALLKFDLGSIPVEAVIDSAVLSLTISKSIAGSVETTVHRVNADWGEGSSDATGQEGKGDDAFLGDATWSFSFYNTTSWSTAGGDFNATASASSLAGNIGEVIFRGSALTADVVAWLENPETNHGWLIISDEGINPSAKRFYSREWDTAEERPGLILYYDQVLQTGPGQLPNAMQMIADPESRQLHLLNRGQEARHLIEIFSITGARLYNNDTFLRTGRNTIGFQPEQTGIYLLRVTVNDKVHTEKFVF